MSTDGSGKCAIEPTRNIADRVWGVLFRIATAEAADLDDAEGLGHRYRKGEVEAVAATVRTQAIAYFGTQKQPRFFPTTDQRRSLYREPLNTGFPQITLSAFDLSFRSQTPIP